MEWLLLAVVLVVVQPLLHLPMELLVQAEQAAVLILQPVEEDPLAV
jgi:hypothetical protein